jgi:hypothetical protein
MVDVVYFPDSGDGVSARDDALFYAERLRADGLVGRVVLILRPWPDRLLTGRWAVSVAVRPDAVSEAFGRLALDNSGLVLANPTSAPIAVPDGERVLSGQQYATGQTINAGVALYAAKLR